MSSKVEPLVRNRKGGSLPRLFLDCDQVLADFEGQVEKVFGIGTNQAKSEIGSVAFWKIIRAQDAFWTDIPVLPEGRRLFESVRHLNPTILTGTPPEVPGAAQQKRAWAARHFPGTPIICCRSEDKYLYLKPGDVLVDDWSEYRHLWEAAGGIFILHRNADDSIQQVLDLFGS